MDTMHLPEDMVLFFVWSPSNGGIGSYHKPKLTQFGHQGIIPLGSAEVSRFAVSVLQFPLTTWIAAALSA